MHALDAAEMILATQEAQFSKSREEAQRQLLAQPQKCIVGTKRNCREVKLKLQFLRKNVEFFMNESQKRCALLTSSLFVAKSMHWVMRHSGRRLIRN